MGGLPSDDSSDLNIWLSVFSSAFLSGELDQDRASVTLAQSQQQVFKLGKAALRAEGTIPLLLHLSENAVKGLFGSLSKAATKEEVLSQGDEAHSRYTPNDLCVASEMVQEVGVGVQSRQFLVRSLRSAVQPHCTNASLTPSIF